jgi:hypothetical protein
MFAPHAAEGAQLGKIGRAAKFLFNQFEFICSKTELLGCLTDTSIKD